MEIKDMLCFIFYGSVINSVSLVMNEPFLIGI